MEVEVHQARKQDVPCNYARGPVRTSGKPQMATISNDELSVKVQVYPLSAEDSGKNYIRLPKAFRMALNVEAGDTIDMSLDEGDVVARV